MAVARQSCFASATHRLRAPWASPVPPPVPFPACHALRPRQSLQRGRHDPRLLLPSRRGTRSASARFVLRGWITSLSLRPVGRSPLRFVVVVTSHDARIDSCWVAGPWQGRNCTFWMDVASSGRTPRRGSRRTELPYRALASGPSVKLQLLH